MREWLCWFAIGWSLFSALPAAAAPPEDCEHDRSAISAQRGTIFEPAPVSAGQWYWKLVGVAWCDETTSGGKINIFYRVQNESGSYLSNQPCIAHYGSTDITIYTKAYPDWGDFPMAGGSWCPGWPDGGHGPYSAWVDGLPSDRVIGMGLPCNRHECYYLRWQKTMAGASATGSISGSVTDQNAQALGGAAVTTSPGGYSATTNASGQYAISNVPVGTYSVTASKFGYVSLTNRNIQVTEAETTVVDYTLMNFPHGDTGAIAGHVDSAGWQASVTLSPGGYSTVTEPDGSYAIRDIPNGIYDVTAYAPTKNERTIEGVNVDSITVNLDIPLTGSGTVAHLLDDFNGNYLFTGDTLEESFQLGFDNHEYFGEYLPDRTLSPHTGTDASQKFQVTINNDQFVSYFETREPNTSDHWFNLVRHAAANDWEEINPAEPITYIVYVKGVNVADDPDDVANKYWRPALGVHYPNINSGYAELYITNANADQWQMLRGSSAGLRDGTKIWLTFESWYPAWYGQWLNGTSWMVFENLVVEYFPITPIDPDPPGPVTQLRATFGGGKVLLTWLNPSDEDLEGVRIEYAILGGGSGETVLLADVPATPGESQWYLHTDPPIGDLAYYVVTYDGRPNYTGPFLPACVQVVATVPPDLDGDGDVDLEDFGLFQRCYSGPGISQGDGACVLALLDSDGDVDQDDFGLFQACFSGPNIPAPGCAD